MIRGVMVIEGSPRGMAKQFRGFVKQELFRFIEDWHEGTLPKHFRNKASRTYGYERRGKYYQRRKERKHLGPLVFTGKSRRMLKRSIKVSGSSKRASGTMQAPPYFSMKPSGHPDKVAELTAVTKKEVLAMAELLSKRVAKKLKQVKDKKIVR